MTTIRLLCCIILSFYIVACASPRQVNAYSRAGFDFTRVQTYSIYDRNSSFSDLQNLSDSTRNTIEFSIERALESSGFIYKNYQEADIIVTYYMIEANILDLQNYNQEVQFCGYCLRVDKTQRKKLTKSYRPGSLVLDVINAKNQSSVWRSVYPLALKEKDNSQEVEEKINNAIHIMMQGYPSA